MAIAYGTSATAALTSSGTSLALPIPASTASGDLLLAYLHFAPTMSALSGMTQNGWTALAWTANPVVEGTTSVLYGFYKIAGSSETGPTVSWTTAVKCRFNVVRYTGVDTTTPIDTSNAASTSGNNASMATPSLTPSTATCWAQTCHAHYSSSASTVTFTPDAALTERVDINLSGSGSAPWVGEELCDSNGAVTQAAHSYTATASLSTTHKISALTYLNLAPPPITIITLARVNQAIVRSAFW